MASQAFAVGWVYAARATRLLAAVWVAESVAAGAQVAYSVAEQRS